MIAHHGLPEKTAGDISALDAAGFLRITEKLNQLGLLNLWLPRPNQFFHVDALPRLATGKTDLRKIRELALSISATNNAA